jgi:hypothetical protein
VKTVLPADPPAEAPAETNSSPSGALDARRSVLRLILAVVAMGAIGVGAVLFTNGHAPRSEVKSPTTFPTTASTLPGPPAFTFASVRVQGVPVIPGISVAAARTVATGIQDTLGEFYQRAFLDQRAWSGLPDATMWDAFAPAIRARAGAAAASLTLGQSPKPIDSLKATDSSLFIRVLLDPRGQPTAAIAAVTFDALGTFSDGETFQIANVAHFLFEPGSPSWPIYGYPGARTEISAPGQTPSPSVAPSGSAGPSASPGTSPTASPRGVGP